MGWVVPAIMAGNAIAGALSNRPSQQKTGGHSVTGTTQQNNSSSETNSNTNTVNRGIQQSRGTTATTGTTVGNVSGTGTSNTSILPQFAAEGQPLLEQLTQRYLQLAQETPNEQALAARGIREANFGAELRKKALGNILAQRGLSTSPAGAVAEIGAESARVSDVVNARSNAPLQAQQLLAQNLGAANGFLQNFRGTQQAGTTTNQQTSEQVSVQNAINEIFQTSRNEQEIQARIQELANSYGIGNQTTDQTGTVTQPGNVAGGAATGGASALALLAALGQIGNTSRPAINVPGTAVQVGNSTGVVGQVSVPGWRP